MISAPESVRNLSRYQHVSPTMHNRYTAPGWTVLGLLTIVMLAINMLFLYLANDLRPENPLVQVMTGIFASEFGVVALWIVLSGDRLVRRIIFLLCAWTTLFSAFMVGVLFSLPPNRSFGAEMEQAFLGCAGCSPLLILAAVVPPLIIRLTGRTLERDPTADHRGSFSIAGIMALTGLVAISFFGVDVLLANALGDFATQRWSMAGITGGVLLGFTLLLTTPVFALLMRERFVTGMFLAVAYAMIAGFITMIMTTAISSNGRDFFPSGNIEQEPGLAFYVVIISFTFAIALFALGLRWCGFRLRKYNVG